MEPNRFEAANRPSGDEWPLSDKFCRHASKAVRPRDIPRLRHLSRNTFPFVEYACDDQATARPDRVAKRWLCGDGFRSGVDQQRSAGRRVVPCWDKTPAHRPQPATGGDDMDLRGRADVIVRHSGQVIGRLRVEDLRHRVMR